ncbi:hypothetical protein LTR86_002655 [Recurvomyces mirabilis]|nr:hypothetical protein LTR86_002655 [Recurvomyces mirabilis]
MDCCNDWHASDDVIVLFYSSRGVFPEAIREIMLLLRAKEKHAGCIHNRCIFLMASNPGLYKLEERTFDLVKVQSWISAHDDELISRQLVFSKMILQSIKQYQRLEFLEATTPFHQRLEKIKEESTMVAAEDVWRPSV